MRAKTRRRLTILAVAFASLLVGGVSLYAFRQHQKGQQTQQFLQDGLAAAAAQDHRATLANLGAYLRRTGSDDPAILYAFAKARANVEEPGRRHLVEAINALVRVVQLDPAHEQARRDLLDLYTRVSRSREALDLADSLLAIEPDDPHALRARALALLRLRRFDEALPVAERYAQLADPSDAYAPFLVLDVLRKLDKPAAEIVRRAQAFHEHDPQDPRGRLVLGYAYALAGDRDAAAQWMRAAAQLQITDPQLVRILVQQLDALALSEEALSVLRRSAALTDADPTLRRDLVQRLWEMRAPGEVLSATAGVDPTTADPTLVALRALSLIDEQQSAAAPPLIDALRLREADPAARAWARFLTVALDETAQAAALVSACREALDDAPDNAYIRYALGQGYAAMGEAELALEAWTRCKTDRPNWAAPLVQMAYALLDSGRPSQALDAAMEAAGRAPDDPDVVIAWIAANSARPERLTAAAAADLLNLIDQVQAQIPAEPRTLPIQVELLARFRTVDAAGEALRRVLVSDRPLDESTLLQLADVSHRFHLGLEEACYDRIRRDHGDTAQLALARATARHERGEPDAVAVIREALGAAPDDRKLPLRIAEATFLDATGDPAAGEAWVALADAFPEDIEVQRLALEARAPAADRDFRDRTIQRLQRLTGDRAVTWRLARAQWLLEAGTGEADASAAKLLQEVISLAPHRVEPQLLLAQALEKLGTDERAIERLTRAADLHPESPDIALHLSQKLLDRGQGARAEAYLQRVLRMPAATSEQRRAAAAMLVDLGRTELALRVLDDEAKEQPDQIDPLIAELYWRAGRRADADAATKKLLDQPDPQRIAFAADYYAATDRLKDAAAALKLLDEPGIAPVQKEMVLGQFFQSQNRPDAAIEHYRIATQLAPRDPEAWQGLVNLLVLTAPLDEIDAAVVAAHEALGDGSPFELLSRRRDLLARLGPRLPEPLRPLVLAVVNEPAFAPVAVEALLLIADAQEKNQDIDKVVVALRSLADRHVRFWALQSLTIQMAMAAGRTDDAVALSTRAAKTFPTQPDAASLAADALGTAGRWAETLVAAQEWRSRAFRDPTWADERIAEARLRLGDPGRALRQLEPYMEEAQRRPDVYGSIIERYARALLAAGQAADAQTLLEPLAVQSPRWRAVWVELAAESVRDAATAGAWLDEIGTLIPDGDSGTYERVTLAKGYFDASQRLGVPALRTRAKELLLPVVAAADAPVEAVLVLAFCAELDNDAAFAERYYRRVHGEKPELAVAANNLAMILLRQKRDVTEAAALAAAAVAAEPQRAHFQHTLALAAAAAGQTEQALAAAKRATELDTMTVEWPLTYAELLVAQGESREAAGPLAKVEQLVGSGAPIDAEQQRRLDVLRVTLGTRPPSTVDAGRG